MPSALRMNGNHPAGLRRVHADLRAVYVCKRRQPLHRHADAEYIRGLRADKQPCVLAHRMTERVERRVVVAGRHGHNGKRNTVRSMAFSGRKTALCSKSVTSTWSPRFNEWITIFSDCVQLG